MGVTHLLSICPAKNPSGLMSVMNHHVDVNGQSPEAFLLVLPSICDYIRDAVKNDGRVLVYCRIESRACTAVCAYCKFSLFFEIVQWFDLSLLCVVMSGGSSYEQAFCVIQNGQFFIYLAPCCLVDSLPVLPLFNPTKIFLQNLERFQASLLMAKPEPLVVKDGISSRRQSNSAAVTKSCNMLERNEPEHTTPISGDSDVFGDSTNLKIENRQSSIPVR